MLDDLFGPGLTSIFPDNKCRRYLKLFIKTECSKRQGLPYHISQFYRTGIKECKRIERSEVELIKLINLEIISPIPPVIESFWACLENKELLKLLSQIILLDNLKIFKNTLFLV